MMHFNEYYASLGYPVCGTAYEWRYIYRYHYFHSSSTGRTADEAFCKMLQIIDAEGASLQAMYFLHDCHGRIVLHFIAYF